MPPIKNMWLFLVSMALVFVVLGFVVERLLFLAGADRTTGEVTNVTSHNSRRGARGGPRTFFHADVSYVVRDQTYSVYVPAGKRRGRDQPLSYAQYEIGSSVPMVYLRRNPTKAYRDAFWDIWGTPLMWFFGQIATLFGSFSERRRTA